jgi:predicted Zn-dependent protease
MNVPGFGANANAIAPAASHPRAIHRSTLASPQGERIMAATHAASTEKGFNFEIRGFSFILASMLCPASLAGTSVRKITCIESTIAVNRMRTSFVAS